MRIQNIQLTNFRSHSDLKLDLSPSTNVLVGSNGAGKTNILEAVLVLANGKSYRGSDSELIYYGQDSSYIKAEVDGKKRSLEIKQKDGKTKKTFLIQGKTIKRLSFANKLPLVLFEPEFLQIIVRGPDWRRDYIDTVLSSTQPGYQSTLSRYRRTLSQRNALLKSKDFHKDQLFVWDISLSELGAQIVRERLELLEKIKKEIPLIYSHLANKKHDIALSYMTKTSPENYASNLLNGLQKNIVVDTERGFTSLGPHRDDITFFINNQEAGLYASRGETRTLLLALKIFELQLVEKARQQKPILLLDDVFSELDETRQTKLVEYFKDNQVIITTTTITPLIKGISGKIVEI